MRKYFFTIISVLVFTTNIHAQSNDSLNIRKFYNEALSNGKAYNWLEI